MGKRSTSAVLGSLLALEKNPTFSNGASGGLDERGHFRGILSAWRRLDAAGHVDHPRLDKCDFRGDVFGSETAGQDQPGQGGNAIEDV